MRSSNQRENIAIALILCIALLTFFFPFVGLRLPVGDQSGGVYDVRSTFTLLHSSLAIFTPPRTSEAPNAAAHPGTATFTTPEPLLIPFSLRMASLPAWLIFAALACAALALLDLFSIRKGVAAISLAGGCFGAVALGHVMLMSSDLRTWTENSMQGGALGSPADPAFPTRVLMLNTLHVNPGPGLYLLTTCLMLVPLLTFTRAIPRIGSVTRREVRVSVAQPVRIRPLNSRYSEETCVSVNLSRNGLCLDSASSHYYVGMEVYVTRDPQPGEPANREEHGSVVRVEKLADRKCRFSIRIIPAV